MVISFLLPVSTFANYSTHTHIIPQALSNTYRTFGAVPVTPTSFFRLLSSGEAVLLYPGGVREGLKRRNEK